MITIRLLALATLVASAAWCIASPGFEPAIVFITSLSALIGTFVYKKTSDGQRGMAQRQSVGPGAIGIQAGRDATVSDATKNNSPPNVE